MQKLVIETKISDKESSRDVIPFSAIKMMREHIKEDDSNLLVVYFGNGDKAIKFDEQASRFSISDGVAGARKVSISEAIDEFLAYEEAGK